MKINFLILLRNIVLDINAFDSYYDTILNTLNFPIGHFTSHSQDIKKALVVR